MQIENTNKEIIAAINIATKAVQNGDFKTALERYNFAAEAGSIDAKLSLATLYSALTDYKEGGKLAKSLFLDVIKSSLSSTKQIALAYHNLATLFMTGADGLLPDQDLAALFEFNAKNLGFPS